jgi:hypothetical protein
MFVEGAEIKPLSVSAVEFGAAGNPTGKCYVSFRSAVHCDLAFTSIAGKEDVNMLFFYIYVLIYPTLCTHLLCE